MIFIPFEQPRVGKILLLAVLAVSSTLSASAQSHFTACAANTGENATVFISPETNPTFNGAALKRGTEIAAFTPAGICAGVVVWDGETVVLTVWGDDSVSQSRDGFRRGDLIRYTIWLPDMNVEVDGVTVGYTNTIPFDGSGRYKADALYSVSSFEATRSSQALPPIASIATSTSEGQAPLFIEFNGTGSTRQSNPIAGYTWFFGDGSAPASGPTQNHTYTIPGSYIGKLEVVDSEGLIGRKHFAITVASGVSIDPIETVSSEVSIFPNPFARSFIIDLNQWSAPRVEVVSLDGKVLRALELSSGSTTEVESAALGFDELASGNYVVRVTDGRRSVTKVVTKRR